MTDPSTVLPSEAGGPAAETPSATGHFSTLPHASGPADHLPPPPPAAFTLPGYELEALLGRGGMGVVYRARQVQLNRPVALKMILAGELAGPEMRERFRAEAEAVARLQHPNIVQIYEVGEDQGRAYFSLELVDGGSLKDRLNGAPLPAAQAAALVEALARAVHYAHQRGIVHRDLKPANILLSLKSEIRNPKPGKLEFRISDFEFRISSRR
jgi:serine/threonine-protein kinase